MKWNFLNIFNLKLNLCTQNTITKCNYVSNRVYFKKTKASYGI